MFRKLVLFFTFTVLLSEQCFGKTAPAYIQPCPKPTSECLKKTIQASIPQFVKGIPQLGIQSTDPLYQEKVELNLAGGFKVQFYNGNATGLRNCVVEFVNFNRDSADINLRCNIVIKGKYKANGRILIVTINGDGDAKLKVSNVKLNATIKFQDKVRNGIVYYEVKDFTLNHQFGKISFVLTNLFKGNKVLSEAVLTFLNENWKPVADEFGRPVVDLLANLVFRAIKKFFHSIPKNELFY